jgi:hypothetical protein
VGIDVPENTMTVNKILIAVIAFALLAKAYVMGAKKGMGPSRSYTNESALGGFHI